MRRAFFRLALVPPLGWALGLWYIARFEGWGAWGAAQAVLLPVLGLSVLLGLAGVALLWRAWRRAESLGALALATAVATSVALYYLVRGVD